MDFEKLVSCIHKKGRQEELVLLLKSAIPKLPDATRKEVTHKIEELAYSFSLEEAREIVHRMTPYGEHWNCDKVKEFITQKGIQSDMAIKYYVVMNMAYNDYHKTAELFGQKENPEFYYQIAYDFINDADGAEFKVEKYFKM